MCRSPQRPEDNLVPLKLELQAVLSHRVGAWDQAPSFVRTETAFCTTEMSQQPAQQRMGLQLVSPPSALGQ